MTAKPRIVLLHGMGGVGKIWRPIAANLEDKFEVLAPDQRGHGGSRAVETGAAFGPLDFGADVVDTMAAANFFPTWVVGHSMGVRTAVALAHLKPEWVSGLVLIDVGVTNTPGAAVVEPLADFLSKLPTAFPDRKSMRAYIDAHAPDPSYGPYLTAVSVQLENGELGFPFDVPALLETHRLGAEAARAGNFEKWVREFAALGKPVHMLHGGKSKVWTQSAYETERKKLADVPGVTFEDWTDAGHGLPFEKRVEFVAWVKKLV